MSNFTPRRASTPTPTHSFSYGAQLCLFVVFEKKAGLIRVADSSVGEIELWDDSGPSPLSPFRRSISSFESLTLHKDWRGTWAPPAEITLPLSFPGGATPPGDATTVYLLTRGRQTHILQAPLRMPLTAHAPLKILKWGMRPTQVVPRACERPVTGEPFLQVTALGEDGVEVQELMLTFLWVSGKGKGRDDDVVVVEADVGPGGAGFLCMGGHWTEQDAWRRRELVPGLRRHISTSTVDSVDLSAKRAREQGFYAWTQKGYDDWRVFWLGGDSNDQVPPGTP